MVLIAEAQQLKAKLMLKGKYRPEKMVRAKMPDGSGMLATVRVWRRESAAWERTGGMTGGSMGFEHEPMLTHVL